MRLTLTVLSLLALPAHAAEIAVALENKFFQ